MLQYIRTNHVLQFVKFGLVGILATLCHMGTLIILVEYLKYQPVLASTIGFIIAVFVSYILNYRYTFMVRGSHILLFSRYLIVCIIGLAINTSIMFLTVKILNWWYIIGQIPTLLIVPIINFLLNKYWTFNIKNKPE